jgi:hypothetical protein
MLFSSYLIFLNFGSLGRKIWQPGILTAAQIFPVFSRKGAFKRRELSLALIRD